MKHRFGLIAEYLVLFIYIFKFNFFLKHRFKCYVGEIDLIFLKKNQLIFIEVKGRKNIINDDLVLVKQQQRIRRAAEYFIFKNPDYRNYDMRFDLAIIQPRKLPIIIKNAF